jgi:hypothetical protein
VKKPTRADRRQAARDAAKLARSRLKLAALEPGGGPDRPLEVPSASIVEPHASSLPCASCGELGVRVEEHVAITTGDARRLRVAHVRCPRCGTARSIYFRLGTALPS